MNQGEPISIIAFIIYVPHITHITNIANITNITNITLIINITHITNKSELMGNYLMLLNDSGWIISSRCNISLKLSRYLNDH